MAQGALYLIPSHLSENTAEKYLTPHLQQVINSTKIYIVENEKSARKFLKEAKLQIPQSELILHPYGKHERDKIALKDILKLCLNGENMGVLSEAGCPAIADPGAEVVVEAHRMNIPVVPLIGGSSILLALMASGFSGQSFCFWGYLPIDKTERRLKIKDLETLSAKYKQTQIFIETPFRNQQLLEEIIQSCHKSTQLCIAKDLTGIGEYIYTAPIQYWIEHPPELHKIPCIFLLSKH